MSTSQSTPALIKACHIHKLPIELLATIFNEHSLQDWQAPFIDSSVCHRWRETTLIYPKLWSRIIISRNDKGPLSRIKVSLSKSRESPLVIHFKHPLLMHAEGIFITNMLFSDETTSRIQVLCDEGTLTAIPAGGVWRSLRALHLNAWGYGNADIPFDRQHFPSLEELILNGEMPLPMNLEVLPPLRYLLVSETQKTGWELLSGCSDTLVELIVHDCQQPPFSATINLPKLRYLAVFDSLSIFADPFSVRWGLAAPNLSILHEQLGWSAPFNLRFNFPSLVEYACRVEFSSKDENVFAERLVLERMALMGPLTRLKNIFRLIASSPHHLPHLSAVELATPDGNPITDSQWLELRDLLRGTPLYTTLKLQLMPRVSSVLRPLRGIFLPFCFPYCLKAFADSAWKGSLRFPDPCGH